MSYPEHHIPPASGYISDSYHESHPRPPVPGEERALGGRCGGSPVPPWYLSHGPPLTSQHLPRRSNLHGYVSHSLSSDCAPMGFEPEGCPSTSVYADGLSRSPPAYLRWARTLTSLLEDREGVELFKKYVEQEGGVHADRLNFYFACEGLKLQTDVAKTKQMVGAIYRFLRKSQLQVPEDLRRKVKCELKEDQKVSVDIYDSMQQEVEKLINDTTYPNFLRSDTYLAHVQAMQNASGYLGNYDIPSDTCSSSSSSSAQMLSCSQSANPLPTLHEDSELYLDQSDQFAHDAAPRLTKDLLMATQKRRLDQRPRYEGFSGLLSRGYSVYSHPHAAYSSYNPVSRQDSELQSISSGRTDSDTRSMSGSSVDGMSIGHGRHARRQHSQTQHRAIRESAQLNREPYMHHAVIPRTQRIQKEQCRAMHPDEFAAILMERLEMVKREQESQDKLDRKLLEGEIAPVDGALGSTASRTIADAIERLTLDEDNDQDILDQHVSRVWSDLTPSRSPGMGSPRPISPPQGLHLRPPHARRRERDVFSTFSSDSGNVMDYHEAHSFSGTMSKSRSVPDYNDGRYNLARRSSSKKTLTDLTDSGVSVVSDGPPIGPLGPPGAPLGARAKDSRVISWLMEGGQPQVPDSRHRKTFSRSSSTERSVHSSHVSSERERERRREPAQPFVADPSMPPPPLPNTATQLEEARRRLLEDERGRQSKQRFSSSKPDTSSAQSTLRRPVRRPAPLEVPQIVPSVTTPVGDHTVVVFSFCDEQFPYRTKIPGPAITLKQFKEYLPKKGNYRYFFKTECAELENQVIQEEVVNDSDMLPLWEGKVMAQVKPCE